MSDVPLCDECFDEATNETDGTFYCDLHAPAITGDGDMSVFT